MSRLTWGVGQNKKALESTDEVQPCRRTSLCTGRLLQRKLPLPPPLPLLLPQGGRVEDEGAGGGGRSWWCVPNDSLIIHHPRRRATEPGAGRHKGPVMSLGQGQETPGRPPRSDMLRRRDHRPHGPHRLSMPTPAGQGRHGPGRYMLPRQPGVAAPGGIPVPGEEGVRGDPV